MSASIIRAVDLRKVYRLYARPSYRFRDMFNLLGNTPGAFTEHAALDGVSLEIARGEKVAIIGRNGAGKSTFLKLVTNVIQPTSGTLDVHGRVHALLQIGSGFHPDFTGRENVHAYFAQLGITGRDARRKCAEVIEFAELEEYIDQPVKTYSTGMAVRLMFSASTAISPELLVLDEVLGVGDAYFSQKSFTRMRELCEGQGATLLLVTHDIYSAVKLCERVVWIDRGRVLLDGDGPSVVKAYESSIRAQEESRLRLKKLERMQALVGGSSTAAIPEPEPLLLEFRVEGNVPAPGAVYFSDVSLRRDGRVLVEWPLDAGAFDETRPSHLQREATVWGEATEKDGRPCRPMLSFGSSFHKVAGTFSLAADTGAASGLTLHVECAAEIACRLVAVAFREKREIHLGVLDLSGAGWQAIEFPLDPSAQASASPVASSSVNTSGIHGTGAMVVQDVDLVDDEGSKVTVVRHGQRVGLLISYEIRDPGLRGQPQIVVALHRDGVQDVCRFIARGLPFDPLRQRTGTIRLDISRLALTNGTYAVTVMVAEEGYYDHEQVVFYSINPGVYHCISRMFEFVVVDSGLIGSGTVSVGEGSWSLS